MKGYFQFTRRQKIGVASLATIILFSVVALNINNHRYLPDPSDVDVSSISFTDVQGDYDNQKNDQDYDHSFTSKSDYKKPKLFKFDPNTLNENGWQDLGFSEKQASSIVNYRSNYGPFYKPEDVQKIYVISDDKYEEIKPFMQFDLDPEEAVLNESTSPIEVNSATQEELETINGIGPAFSKRTIKYRNLLGGYASKDQFENIYGITEEALKALKENVIIDLNGIEKIKINSASKDEIKKHPYLKDWAVVAAIISERDKTKLTDLNFLTEQDLMTQNELEKVLPYISFE